MAQMTFQKKRELALASIESLIKTGIDLPGRRLLLGAQVSTENPDLDVNAQLALNVRVGMYALETMYFPSPGEEPKEHIDVEIVSYGGDLYHALGIYDRIAMSPCPVHIHVSGPCMSGGALILQAGTKRLISPHSRLMLHYGFTWDEGTSDPRRIAESLREHEELMSRCVAIFLSRSNQEELAKDMVIQLRKEMEGCSIQSITGIARQLGTRRLAERMMRSTIMPIESYFDAKECKRLGFVDDIEYSCI